MTDFFQALRFLIVVEALSLPLRFWLASLRMSDDTRRVASRLAGPLIVALPVWAGAHATGILLHPAAGWALTLMALAGWGLLLRRRRADPPPRRGAFFSRWGVDLLSLILFFGFVALRRHVPGMTTYALDGSGAEKFTNAMLFWSGWHATVLPPQDYWLAGQPLVYYYWGHWFWAWAGRLAGIPGELALNLALARVTVHLFEAAWLAGRALRLNRAWAAAAALAAAWGGNPAAIAVAWRWLGTPGAAPVSAFSYWDPSRAIAGTVTEFPAFSAILGDFHAHHLALPWLLGCAALLLRHRRWTRGSGPLARAALAAAVLALAIPSVLANMWNLPLLAAAIFLWLGSVAIRRDPRRLLAAVTLALVLAALLAGGLGLMRAGAALPFAHEEATGLLARLPLRILPSGLRSSAAELWLCWGFPVGAIALAAAAAAFRRPLRLIPVVAGTALTLLGGPWFWLGVILWIAASVRSPRRLLMPAPILLSVLAVGLSLLELFYIDDSMGGELERYNSYFKLAYPIWPLLIVAAAPAASALWSARRPLRLPARALLVLLAAAIALYPLLGWPARIAQSRASGTLPAPPTLDMAAFLSYRPPWSGEAGLIDWIHRFVPAGDVVIEGCNAEPYVYGGRVAALAGRPIPLGWGHHEHQWRGGAAWPLISSRIGIIERLYRGADSAAVRTAAQELGSRWILYGYYETQRFGAPSPAILGAGRIAAQTGGRAGGPYYLIELEPEAP